jgi:hypothetical protein
MKFPVSHEHVRAMFIEATGEEPREDAMELLTAAFSLVNKAYEQGRRDALAQLADQKGGVAQ